MWELYSLAHTAIPPTVVRIYNAQRHLAWWLAQSQCSGNAIGNYGSVMIMVMVMVIILSKGCIFPFFFGIVYSIGTYPFAVSRVGISQLLFMYCFQGSCSDDEIYSPLKNQLMCVPYGGFPHTCVHPHIQGWPCGCCVYVCRGHVLSMFTLNCSPLTCLFLLPGCGDPKRRIRPCSSLQFRTSDMVCLKVDIQQNVKINKYKNKEGDKTILP